MLPSTSDFPHAIIGLNPDFLQMLDQRLLQGPAGGCGREPMFAGLEKGIDKLAKNIKLKLIGRRIADTHWR